jgi:membrane-bound ClpP family serine protease
MEWITVILLLFGGISLVLIEIIFIPGTNVVGIVGIGLLIAGVVVSFTTFGTDTGVLILCITVVLAGVSIYFGLKSGVLKTFSLSDTNKSHVNDEFLPTVLLNEEGMAVSDLRPVGKAEFSNRTYEVRTIGRHVDAGVRVKVIKIDNNHRIFVEPLI